MGDGCGHGAVVVPGARELLRCHALARAVIARRAGDRFSGAGGTEETGGAEIVLGASRAVGAEEMLRTQDAILDTVCIGYTSDKRLIEVIAHILSQRVNERPRDTSDRFQVGSPRTIMTARALPPVTELQKIAYATLRARIPASTGQTILQLPLLIGRLVCAPRTVFRFYRADRAVRALRAFFRLQLVYTTVPAHFADGTL